MAMWRYTTFTATSEVVGIVQTHGRQDKSSQRINAEDYLNMLGLEGWECVGMSTVTAPAKPGIQGTDTMRLGTSQRELTQYLLKKPA